MAPKTSAAHTINIVRFLRARSRGREPFFSDTGNDGLTGISARAAG